MRWKNAIRLVIVSALLGIYGSALVLTNLHLSHDHAHSAHEACTAESEQDACHRSIYHADESADCGHPEHITADTHSCELCDAICPLPQLASELLPPPEPSKQPQRLLAIPEQEARQSDARNPHLRGPPAV